MKWLINILNFKQNMKIIAKKCALIVVSLVVMETPWAVTKGRNVISSYDTTNMLYEHFTFRFNDWKNQKRALLRLFGGSRKIKWRKFLLLLLLPSFFPPLTSFSFVFYSHNPFLSIFVSFLFSTKLQGAHDAQFDGK